MGTVVSLEAGRVGTDVGLEADGVGADAGLNPDRVGTNVRLKPDLLKRIGTRVDGMLATEKFFQIYATNPV
jgi:hypothetical protein